MTKKTKLLLVVSFLGVFSAGVATGLVTAKPAPRPHEHSWLMSELNLTSQQREQMRKIWSETVEASMRQRGEQRRGLADERDKAVVALLDANQQARYDQIMQDYSRKTDELQQQGKKAFDLAAERTRQILTPEQVKQYDELIKKMGERGPGSGGPGGPPWGGRGHSHRTPRSMPASMPASAAANG